MTLKRTDLIALLLLVAGLGLLATTFFARPAPPDSGPPLSEALRLDVDTDRLLALPGFTLTAAAPGEASILAVFALHAKVCPPCLNEIQEYAELLQLLDQDGAEIESLALVFEADPDRAERFLEISGLQLSAAYGHSEELAELLGSFDRSKPMQQIVFVDLERERLFYRVLLLNQTTTPELKRDLLEQMLAAREELPS